MQEKEEKNPLEEQDEKTRTYQINGVQQLPVLNGDNYELTKQIADIEENIRKNKTFETAVVIDLKGNMVIAKRGEHTQVGFTRVEAAKMKDCIVTHNHPYGWGYEEKDIRRIGNSFSINDILLAVDYDMMEIRAVTPIYTFSMKRPRNGWGVTAEEIDIIYKRANESLCTENSKRIRNGMFTIERTSATHYHLIWKKISKELGWEYRKMKTKG